MESNALLSNQPPELDFIAMAHTQSTDPLMRSLQSSTTSTLVVEAVPLEHSPHPLYCDTSTGTQRPIVPLPLETHSLQVPTQPLPSRHPGHAKTYNLPICVARYQFRYSPWTRSCIQCQRAKIQRHTTVPLSPYPTPNAHFDVIHIDIIGPLPPSQCYTYLLTCVDRYTCWPEAIPLSSITAEAVAQTFISGWIA